MLHLSPRRVAGFGGLVASALIGSVIVAGAAFAHHPEITGTADCTDAITFTSTAWSPATDAERTNPTITISYAVDGSATYTALPADAAYHYDSANSFTFTDTFTPAAGWSSITVRATATGTWGSGAAGGDSRTSAPIARRTDCAPAPAASVADATCADDGAVVQLTNSGDDPVDFTITGGATEQVVTVAGGETTAVTVVLPADTDTTITVTADGLETVTRAVSYHCAQALPAAVVADATCAAGGAVVRLHNTGDAPVDFTIAVPGEADVVTTVAAGSTVDVPVMIPADVTRTITVSAPGMSDVVSQVTDACVEPDASGGTDGAGPTAAFLADQARAAAAAEAAALAAAQAAAAAPGGQLPRTGVATDAMAISALVTILAGFGLVLAGRRFGRSCTPLRATTNERIGRR